MAAPLEDCCGLGCNNCILDRFLDRPRPVNSTKVNLFNLKGFQKFRVKNIERDREFIYKFTFELVNERVEPFKKDEQLIAPPVSYLMLRAPRQFDQPFNPMFEEFREFLDPPQENNRYFRSEPQRFDKGTPEIYYSRKYTPWELNEELRTFKIIVKLEKYGKMSKYFTHLSVGSVCDGFKGPFEAFNYQHEKIENFVVFTQGNLDYQTVVNSNFLSAILILGISIVSAFRLVKEIIYESAQSRILLVSCFKNLDEAFLREDFFALTHFWCLKHHIFLSENLNDPKIPQRSGEKIHNERLDSENFKQLMKELKYFDPERTQVLISGRESFIDFAKSLATENRYKNVEII